MTDNYAHFDQVTSFKSVEIGQYFIYMLSSFSIVYIKTELVRNGHEKHNARQQEPGRPRFTYFYGWEPVRVCGVRQDALAESETESEQV